MWTCKVYVIQRADPVTGVLGEVVGAKLTRIAAQAVAKEHAPAKVLILTADKSLDIDPKKPQPNT